jgi:hypothetical protein
MIVEIGKPVDIINGKRGFHEEDVVRLQLAHRPERFLGIGPAVANVYHRDLVPAYRLPAGCGDLHNGLVAFLQAVVSIGTFHTDFHLSGFKSQTPGILELSQPTSRVALLKFYPREAERLRG